jgi:hypothetical protein
LFFLSTIPPVFPQFLSAVAAICLPQEHFVGFVAETTGCTPALSDYNHH